MDLLLNKAKASVLPDDCCIDVLPDKFNKFFQDKVEKIQSSFKSTASVGIDNTCNVPTASQLANFSPATSDEIRKIIEGSPSKSCQLDPLPTFLLKSCLDDLLPVITYIINSSMSTGDVPQQLKKAVVTPLLKKRGLDNNVASFKPPLPG